jgi:FkbM family methyltransferase
MTEVNLDELTISQRVRRFAARSRANQIERIAARVFRIFPRSPTPLRLSFGAWMLVGQSYVDRSLLSGGFEAAEILFVKKYLQPGMTVLDIGAHHGLYTLLASKRVGANGKVVAFEPSPRERKQLRRNVLLNFSFNVHIEPLALGKESSDADLHLVEGGEDGCNSLRPPVVSSSTRPVRVKVAPLDEFLQGARIPVVDFVKLDVEGAELDVLKGAEKLLHGGARPVFLVEVYDIRTRPWGYDAREIVQFLSRAGFRWFQLKTAGFVEPISPDIDTYDMNLVAVPEEGMHLVDKCFEHTGPARNGRMG